MTKHEHENWTPQQLLLVAEGESLTAKSALESAARQLEQSGWRDIRNAPRDGERVDLMTAMGRVTDAWYSQKHEDWVVHSLKTPIGDSPIGATVTIDAEVTHWVPLLGPPHKV